MDLGTVHLDSVDHAVFVLTVVGDRPLTDAFRFVLWQRFGVPVYQLYMDTSGALLATECEAQEGWHIEGAARFSAENRELLLHSANGRPSRTGIYAYLEKRPCACGRTAMRIVELDRHAYAEAEPLLAAIA
jgi:hypothetical protein